MQDNRLIANLRHNLGEIITALDDPNVIEILLNPDGKLWVESLGKGMEQVGEMQPHAAEQVISLVASSLSTTTKAERSIIEGELPIDRHRFEGLLPPVVTKTIFSIRKKASKIFSLADYVDAEIMAPTVLDTIESSITTKQNILVVGGTGSGKTTLVNGIIQRMSVICPADRLIIVEDTGELQSSSQNSVFLRASTFISMQRLIKATMRLRPDRIIIGEVRGGEALDLLKAWNTGHPGGVATIHANSAHEGLLRLEGLVEEVTAAPKQKLIAASIDVVIFITRTREGRRITEVVKVTDYDTQKQDYQLECIHHETLEA